jgi:hypothetical protein
MDAKEEIKKSAIAETVKTVIQSLLPQIVTLALLVVSPVRDRIWPAIPKWLVMVIATASMSVNLWLLRRLRRHHSELAQKEEHAQYLRDQIELRTSKVFKYNAYWDADQNPYCPSCKTPLGDWQPAIGNTRNAGYICSSCHGLIPLKDDYGRLMSPVEAKDRISKEGFQT